ncbi:hypothetical protein MBLNU457_g3060t1 [Dothideomycetes sp. NU457]
MRDRRNTNLSISSLSSFSAGSTTPVAVEDTEKGRFLWLPAQPNDNGLPSPLIKHERESRKSLRERLPNCMSSRHLIAGFVFILFVLGYYMQPINSHTFTNHDRSYELAQATDLDTHVGPVILKDQYGRKRWTMNVPRDFIFPLSPVRYRDMCTQSEEVSAAVMEDTRRNSRILGRGLSAIGQSYYANDRGYLDIGEAEKAGLLASQGAPPTTLVAQSDTSMVNVCDRSLTFVLESEEVGFGHSLMLLWLSYGLAKKEGRAFFVDDTRWQYGGYLSYFPKPPQPSCAPPPSTQIVPCPHQAKHLVVSAATAPWTFGAKFHQQFENSRRSSAKKQREIFGMIRSGYDALFSVPSEDASFYVEKLATLRALAESQQQPLIGMHIRRGDCHPFELEFSRDYLPLDRFVESALTLFPSTSNATLPRTLLLASDDPDLIVSPSLLSTLPASPAVSLQKAQDRIILASKRTLTPSVPERNGAYTKHVDENSGWEGGFFAPLFRSLGRLGRTNHPSFHSAKELKMDVEARLMKQLEGAGESQAQIEKNARTLKELVGRAYLLDLAVLGQNDGVVCAVSSAACRVVGVMMGWEKVVGGQWINVDDGRSWSWDGRR